MSVVRRSNRLGEMSPIDVEFQERLSSFWPMANKSEKIKKRRRGRSDRGWERETGPQNRDQMCVSQRYGVICSPSLSDKKEET